MHKNSNKSWEIQIIPYFSYNSKNLGLLILQPYFTLLSGIPLEYR